MDTIKLKHFCAVYETNSLTRAAKIMGISHPGLHKSLKALERELGVELTLPDGRGIAITPKGKEIYAQALAVIKAEEDLQLVLKSSETKEQRFGIAEIFCFSLPSFLMRELPHYSFSFHERCPGEIEPQVASGALDFGITTFPVSHSGIEYSEIATLNFELFSSRKRKLGDDITFIIPSSTFERRQRDHWREDLYPRKKILKANMLSIAIELMKNGEGALYLPEFLASYLGKNNTSLFRIETPQNLQSSVTIYFVSRLGEKKSELAKKLIPAIVKHLT